MNTTAVRDLSLVAGPVSDLFPQPRHPDDWERLKLSGDQVAFYYEHGFLAGVSMLDGPQIESLRTELQRLMEPEHPGHRLFYEFHSNESVDPARVLFHALGTWRIEPGFHDLLWNPRFTMAARQLLNGPVRFWHDQLFCKPAQHGGVVAWHQDYSYWTRTRPMAHLTCWIALDDSTIDNGCVYYIPGSHRWPLLPVTGLAGDMDSIRAVLTNEQWEQFQHPVAVELPAGQCSFHHPLTMHGSYANSTPRPRRAAVLNVFRDGVASASDDVLLTGVPPIPSGQTMSGRFFPLLTDATSAL